MSIMISKALFSEERKYAPLPGGPNRLTQEFTDVDKRESSHQQNSKHAENDDSRDCSQWCKDPSSPSNDFRIDIPSQAKYSKRKPMEQSSDDRILRHKSARKVFALQTLVEIIAGTLLFLLIMMVIVIVVCVLLTKGKLNF